MATKCKLTVLLGILLVSIGFVEQSDAQRRGLGGQRGGLRGGQQQVSEMSLLQMKVVLQHLQEDFGLQQETTQKIAEITEQLNEQIADKRRSLMQDFREMGQDERQQAMKEVQQVSGELNKEAFKKIRPMLSREQLKRLGELKMQRMGNAALRDSLVQEILGFTSEQVERLSAQQKSFDDKRREFMDDFREQMQAGDRESMRERMAEMQDAMLEMRERMEEAITSLLSDDQKKKLKELQGEAFKFPEPRRRRDS